MFGTNYRYDALGHFDRFALGARSELQAPIAAFQAELAAAEATIEARNASRFAPFIHMLPSRISNGVTI